MNDDTTEMNLVSGLVKWFDQSKGFGFIVSEDGDRDILLHANVLRNFGRNSVADRSRIIARVQPTTRGLQATEIIEITPPESDGASPIEDLDPDVIARLETLPLQAARVKWFDKAKGFGFANIFGHPDDVFIHIEVLRHSGFSDMGVGEAIGLRAVEGRRGLIAAQVTSWDEAMESASLQLFSGFSEDCNSDPAEWRITNAAE